MPTTLFSPLMTVSDARSHGEVYTRRWVVETILDLVGYGKDQDLGAMIAIEPAAGAFLEPMVARLIASARSHARDPASLAGAIRAYDLHERSAVTARTMVEGVLAASGVDNLTRMRLASDWVVCGDFLLDETTPLADVVVGNPPYVRLEDMDPAFAAHYRALWPTMTGRADLYIAFIEKSLDRLKTGGRVGFICADRWMHNAYGLGAARTHW